MSNGSRSTCSSVHSSTITNRCPSTQVTLKPPPQPPNPLLTPPAVPLGNADSGTTGHYFALRDSAHLTDVRPTSAPVSIETLAKLLLPHTQAAPTCPPPSRHVRVHATPGMSICSLSLLVRFGPSVNLPTRATLPSSSKTPFTSSTPMASISHLS